MAMVLRAVRHDDERAIPTVTLLRESVIRGADSQHPAWVAERKRRRAHDRAMLRQRQDAEMVNRVWARVCP